MCRACIALPVHGYRASWLRAIGMAAQTKVDELELMHAHGETRSRSGGRVGRDVRIELTCSRSRSVAPRQRDTSRVAEVQRVRNIRALHTIGLIPWVVQDIGVPQTTRAAALLIGHTRKVSGLKSSANSRFAMYWRDILPLWPLLARNLLYQKWRLEKWRWEGRRAWRATVCARMARRATDAHGGRMLTGRDVSCGATRACRPRWLFGG